VWHNVHSQQHTHMSSSYRSSRLGLLHLDPYAMHRGGCLEWSGPGGIQALSARPTSFLQCFDTVGLVMWPVKIVPDMTYNVFGGTLNLAVSIMSCARFSTIAPPTTMLSNGTYLMARLNLWNFAGQGWKVAGDEEIQGILYFLCLTGNYLLKTFCFVAVCDHVSCL